MKLWQIFCFNLLLLVGFAVQAADIQVSVDRNPIALQDTFQIIFTATDEPDANPDFAPLQQNFEILNQQRSSNLSWVNGKSTRSEKWVVNVIAKQAGELLIPPVSFGKDISKPLKIVVSEDQNVSPQSNDDLILEVTVNTDKPYVQSQVLYTVKFFRRLQITQARLDEPQLKDAVVEKLGEDSNYSTLIQGVEYAVTERRYALFPQQSGDVTIPPLTLLAEVLSSRQSHFNGFFNPQTTESRRLVSKAIALHVQAAPAKFNQAAWLSAETLTLTENWSSQKLETKVGEPITRTLRLTAKGATVGQLPELSTPISADGIKSYPDQPLLQEDKQADGLTAIREEKIAYIPTKPGEVNLPAVEISWFNTKTEKIETARLPSITIHALANGDQPVPVTPASTNQNQSVPVVAATAVDNTELRLWQGIAVFTALGWLMTVVWIFYRRPRSAHQSSAKTPPPATANYEKQLAQACRENKPQAAKAALIEWGKAEFAAASLGSIANYCQPPLRQEIELLNQLLYSGQQHDWQGAALLQAFQNQSGTVGAKTQESDGLEPLFKL